MTLLKRLPFSKDSIDVCSKAWEGPEDSQVLSFMAVTKAPVKGDPQSQAPWSSEKRGWGNQITVPPGIVTGKSPCCIIFNSHINFV